MPHVISDYPNHKSHFVRGGSNLRLGECAIKNEIFNKKATFDSKNNQNRDPGYQKIRALPGILIMESD